MKRDELAGYIRAVTAVAVLCMDVLLMVAAAFIISLTRNRGVRCDGAGVLCTGGDPTHAQWLAEMSHRSTAAYTSFAVVALIVIASVLIAWRRQHEGVVAMQCLMLAVVAVLAYVWEPHSEYY